VFFVADTEATGSMVPGEFERVPPARWIHLFFPMRGTDRWRVIGILPEHLRESRTSTFEERSPRCRKEAGAQLSFKALQLVFELPHPSSLRRAFPRRRCFLLGDAAHVHSPMGGQGMNTGLQDAYNLAWKLALVVSGKADAALLDSYASERIPVAHRLLRTTDRAFTLVVSDSRIAGLFRTRSSRGSPPSR